MTNIAIVLVSVLNLVSAVQAWCPPQKLCPHELPHDLICLTLVHSMCAEFRDGILTDSKIGILSKLQSLILNNCGITALMKSPFQGNKDLKVLQLLSNQFQTFSQETFRGLTGLQVLVMKKSNITALPVGGFQLIQDLVSLDLQANQISTLEEDSFGNLSKLESLDVSYNSIDGIDGRSFKFLMSMTIINLQNNKISFLPDEVFTTLTHLRKVNLNSNQLVTFPDRAFQNMSLDSLNLASNQLTSIPKVRTNILNLENNQITSIKAVDFSEEMAVHHVNLRHNPITNIESGAFANSHITLLNLESTELTFIPDNTIVPSVSVMTLYLGNNVGWECDCHQLWLVRYLQTTPNATQPICGSGKFVGKNLRKIADELEAGCTSTSVAPLSQTGSTVSTSSKSGTNYNSQQTSIHGNTEFSTKWTPLSSTAKVTPNLKNTGEPSQFTSTTAVKEVEGASHAALIAGVTCALLLMSATITSVIMWKKFKVSSSRTATQDQWPEEASSENKGDLLADSSIPRQPPVSFDGYHGVKDGPYQKRYQAKQHYLASFAS